MNLSELTEEELLSIKYFSFENYSIDARFCRIHDGDTVSAVFQLDNVLIKHICRLSGIDTPEITSKNPQEKNLAILARDYLIEKLRGKVLNIKCGKFDKYGRLLITIYEDSVDISEKMIKLGLAKKYTGGTKEPWIF